MKRISILLTLVLLLHTLAGQGQTAVGDYRSSLEQVNRAFSQKDKAGLRAVLSPGFTVGTHTGGFPLTVMDHVVENGTIASVTLSDKPSFTEGNATVVPVTMHLPSGQTAGSFVAFDDQGKILYFDYIDNVYGQSRHVEPKLLATIPFTHENNYVILTVRINDYPEPLSFLLDTGADGMAIRTDLAEKIGLQVHRSNNATMVGGQQQIRVSEGNTVHFSDEFSVPGQSIAIFPEIGSHDGIVGSNVIRRFITQVNFDRRQISFHTFGRQEWAADGKGVMLPVKDMGGVYTVPSSVNLTGDQSVSGNFLMDTGANYNLILFSPFVRANRLLLSGWKSEGQATTTSMGIVTPTYYGTAKEFMLGDIVVRDMPVTLQASSAGAPEGTPGNSPDGSIGIVTFSNYNWTLDLLRKELYLQPREGTTITTVEELAKEKAAQQSSGRGRKKSRRK